MTPQPARPLEPFALTGPLPDTMTMIEASAGTGKTFALAALAARYVAERGMTASQLCIVSFTEAATAELRGRIRSRLVGAAGHLAAGGGEVADDEVLTALGAVDATERSRRVARLERAITEFDTATITTIHGLCHRIVASGPDGAEATVTLDDLDIAEVLSDEYLARFGTNRSIPAPLERLISAVGARLRLPDAVMFRPPDEARTGRFTERVRILDEVADLSEDLVGVVRRYRRYQRRRSFDTLLTDALDLTRGPGGSAAVAALRSRFGVVMIDEFQDTDQVQWDIFRRAFVDGENGIPVILVGDPKQSIYRFRGAELSAYLQARDHAAANGGRQVSLDRNFRSDAALLEALAVLFESFSFSGDGEGVMFSPVRPAHPDRESRMEAPGPTAPLVLRHVPQADGVGQARARVRSDLVAEVTDLLNGAWITDGNDRRRLEASDIGILVRSNADAVTYAADLVSAGVPVAISGSDSVLATEAAWQWRVLLDALDRPTSPPKVRAAALGWFIGMTVPELAAADDEQQSDLMDRLRRWSAILSDRGFAALWAELRTAGIATRVLARAGGERDFTDLEHIAELLQGATAGRPVSAAGLLVAWRGLAGPDALAVGEEAAASDTLVRRIDRDDHTVKVLTIHAAKGLEFEVVLCPTLWTSPGGRLGIRHGYCNGQRLIDTNQVAVDGPGRTSKLFTSVELQDRRERDSEDRRLLYVALTRARHRLVVWWHQPDTKGKTPPLRSLLAHASQTEDHSVDLEALARRAAGRIAVVEVDPRRTTPGWRPPSDHPPAELAVAHASRRLDDRWRIWSFTTITNQATAAVPAELPPLGGVDEPPDNAVAAGPTVPDHSSAADHSSSAARRGPDLPGGRVFGTLVHSVLEQSDFSVDDLREELRSVSTRLLGVRPLRLSPEDLAGWLEGPLRAPLGGPVGSLCLADLSRGDRLDELRFDLPLAGLEVADIARVLRDHLPDDDLLAPWVQRVVSGGLDLDLRGWLNGSIDLVARCSPNGPFWLADYKTNRLDPGSAYRPADLVPVMEHAHYPLQAILYLVALHRFLRWRRPSYRPDQDLLGAVYLFLRGMDPGRPAEDPGGVYWWRPPTAALDELDELFTEGRSQ